jgi:hypothetical protein
VLDVVFGPVLASVGSVEVMELGDDYYEVLGKLDDVEVFCKRGKFDESSVRVVLSEGCLCDVGECRIYWRCWKVDVNVCVYVSKLLDHVLGDLTQLSEPRRC